jgi:hypothetical protein
VCVCMYGVLWGHMYMEGKTWCVCIVNVSVPVVIIYYFSVLVVRRWLLFECYGFFIIVN